MKPNNTRALSLLALLMLLVVVPARAQIDITEAPIPQGVPVTDTITADAFFDWWTFSGTEGDEIRVVMTGTDGLAPLVGLLDSSSNLIERSPNGEPDGTVSMTATLPYTGSYRFVATRTGRDEGITTGGYTLLYTVTDSAGPDFANRYAEVVFLCEREEVANALTLDIEDDADQLGRLRISVYGLDGFDPILRTQLELETEPFFDDFCFGAEGDGPGYGRGDLLTLPGQSPLTIDAASTRTTYEEASTLGLIRVNVGARGGSTGRYVVVIDGLTVGPNNDRDLLEVGLGPLARDTTLDVYMVADKTTRLDPYMALLDDELEPVRTCDDAGLRECADVPPLLNFSLDYVQFDADVLAGPFDAGLRLEPGTPDKQRLLMGAFDGRTSGGYAVVIVGEFPG